MGTDGCAVAEHDQVHYGLPVDGISHGLAHLFIVKRRRLVVGGHDDFAGGRTIVHLETFVLGQRHGGLRRCHVADDIDVSGLECRQLSTGIADKLESDLIQVGKGWIPVTVETGHLYPVAAHPLHKPEGSGAHRGGLGALVAHHGQHDCIPFGHVGDKKGVHLFEGQDEGIVVRGFHLADPAKVFRMGVDGLFIHGAFQVPLSGGSVEILVIVKLDALSEMEGVG